MCDTASTQRWWVMTTAAQIAVALVALVTLWCVLHVLATLFVGWLYRDEGGLPLNWRCLWLPAYVRWLDKVGRWP